MSELKYKLKVEVSIDPDFGDTVFDPTSFQRCSSFVAIDFTDLIQNQEILGKIQHEIAIDLFDKFHEILKRYNK